MSDYARGAVVATAGHVDHGKTALVRALTGMETDRLEAEKRRGLTIDLGFAWTELDGRAVSFIDVPGHERFLDNALTGLSSAPVALFVVAADAGWSRQSSEHRDVLAALDINYGVVALTRSDLATPEQMDRARTQVQDELRGTGLQDAPVVVASAVTGTGIAQLRTDLSRQIALAESAAASANLFPTQPGASNSIRLWLDRSFSIAGAGTVVTGTLTQGELAIGDVLELHAQTARQLVVRGLQSRGTDRDRVTALDRVAVNLRGIEPEAIGRGSVLVTPGIWDSVHQLDARLVWGESVSGTARFHLGTAEVAGHVRPLAEDYVRVTLRNPLPLAPGDRLVLRPDHGRQVVGAVRVLALDPMPLMRRGAGKARARELAELETDPTALINRRGWIASADLQKTVPQLPAELADIVRIDDWWISAAQWEAWTTELGALIAREYQRDPLTAGVSAGAAMRALRIPDVTVLDALVPDAGFTHRDGMVTDPKRSGDLGPIADAVCELEGRLSSNPFAAPEAAELEELGLGHRELAAAERAGRLLRLRDDIILLPDAPARAMLILARQDATFTVSQARQALETTRRVAVPLLEYLDGRGWTRRLDASRREIVR